MEAGFLQISGVRAEGTVFQWVDDSAPGERRLVWPDGTLTLPDALVVEDFGVDAILVPYTDQMQGSGSGGVLEFVPGSYVIEEALHLTDGTMSLDVSAGRLEIRSGRISYEHKPGVTGNPGQYFVLGGVVLAIMLLMKRARRRGGS